MTDRNNRNSLQDKHPFIKETIKEPPSDRKSVAKKLLLAFCMWSFVWGLCCGNHGSVLPGDSSKDRRLNGKHRYGNFITGKE